ncbi:hypothetical protein BGZ61DRAFT_476115 [Ilyonectria robusta]|uniref:uncharacterized protein n=1 Tax=Ilyonectria robusta TaxID=1079257 RepID=UPI001E8EB656|nr:uncharacterized protein BGZ61DRAFT_476115 [Ilyonectria robusta]KAH8722217.1 hypothetical protein BGZ61DRAFT_476115 [Ilyonectria robusta]
MADDSCSGGNPFKRLTEQQSRDGSRHQDRLVNRPGAQAPGSFRTGPQAAQGPNGFNQFMDGPAALPGMSGMAPMAHQHAANRLATHATALQPAHAPGFAPQNPQFQARHAPADGSNWAADFGRFTQQRQPQNGFTQAAPQMRMAQGNPQMHMAQGNPQMHMAQSNSMLAFNPAGLTLPNAGFSPLYGPTNGGHMDASSAIAQRHGAEADFDREMDIWMSRHGSRAEDVVAVMERIADEAELNEAAFNNAEAADQEAAEAETRSDGDFQTPDIAALSLETRAPVESESTGPAKAKSEVSEAAERLLESVQHEEGDKWKNSTFLSLMRDFRDGRKDIVDNEIRDTPESDEEGPKAPQ